MLCASCSRVSISFKENQSIETAGSIVIAIISCAILVSWAAITVGRVGRQVIVVTWINSPYANSTGLLLACSQFRQSVGSGHGSIGQAMSRGLDGTMPNQ